MQSMAFATAALKIYIGRSSDGFPSATECTDLASQLCITLSDGCRRNEVVTDVGRTFVLCTTSFWRKLRGRLGTTSLVLPDKVIATEKMRREERFGVG